MGGYVWVENDTAEEWSDVGEVKEGVGGVFDDTGYTVEPVGVFLVNWKADERLILWITRGSCKAAKINKKNDKYCVGLGDLGRHYKNTR